jgi:DNA-directed RNA polymerase subunit F
MKTSYSKTTKQMTTAEKFFNKYGGYTRKEMLERAKEFAKLHVEAQRECVEEEVSKTDLNTGRQLSIINAYPLTNIK